VHCQNYRRRISYHNTLETREYKPPPPEALLNITANAEMFILSFHAGSAGDRLLGPCLYSATTVRRIVYRDFQRNFLPELLQHLNLQTKIYLWFM
jgi:hypothetical protein